jgi:hypothetical protein
MISRMAMAGDLICAPARVNPLEKLVFEGR